MNNIFVYCELENDQIADISLELLTKGRELANLLDCKLEAIVLGSNIKGIEKQIFPYGVDFVHIGDNDKLSPYLTLVHSSVILKLLKDEEPQIVLFGASSIGRDLAPRISSALSSGLTADCTSLVIGDYTNKKLKKEYKNILYQIRPAFGGNIIATIINPDHRPQMATIREGVMKKEIYKSDYVGVVKTIDVPPLLSEADFAIQVIERHIEKKEIDIKNSQIIVAGGYGVGSKENFQLLSNLANAIGGDVAASRAAVDAGYAVHDQQVGQTGVTVRPKLYIACGISGAVQHRAGMEESAIIISINTDPNAPINTIADYKIIGSVADVIPKMIKYYKANSK